MPDKFSENSPQEAPPSPAKKPIWRRLLPSSAPLTIGENGGPIHDPSQLPTHNENLIARANKFKSLRVDDVMVPRADIIAVDVETKLGEVLKKFKAAGHSRLPIFKDDLDEAVGFAHIKDLVGLMAPNGRAPQFDFDDVGILAKIKRRVEFVPASMYAETLLIRMQATRVHMALVIDEYGGVDGLVTLEDLVEPIVGDIEDEHDSTVRPKIIQTGDGVWESGTRVRIEELEQVAGLDLTSSIKDEDIDTLGGLVFTLAGKVPKHGEIVPHEAGINFQVLESDSRRIRRLRMVLTANAATESDSN